MSDDEIKIVELLYVVMQLVEYSDWHAQMNHIEYNRILRILEKYGLRKKSTKYTSKYEFNHEFLVIRLWKNIATAWLIEADNQENAKEAAELHFGDESTTEYGDFAIIHDVFEISVDWPWPAPPFNVTYPVLLGKFNLYAMVDAAITKAKEFFKNDRTGHRAQTGVKKETKKMEKGIKTKTQRGNRSKIRSNKKTTA